MPDRRDSETVGETLDRAERQLTERAPRSARLEARRLLACALDVPPSTLLFDGSRSLSSEQLERFDRMLARRLGGEPLQHIEGTVQFRLMELRCDRRALIPRPETEQLVDEIIRFARSRHTGELGSIPGPLLIDVLDIGTGTGAIALALLSEGIAGHAVGLDVSTDAIALAKENRALLGLEDAFDLRLCGRDPYASLEPNGRFDAIVSNPPYIRDAEIETLQKEVRDFEPRLALSGGADGLDTIRAVVHGSARRLRARGALFLEIGAEQGDSVARLVEAAAFWRRVEVRRDLAARDRFVVAEL
jgi:release factor glutamine methyltransferase